MCVIYQLQVFCEINFYLRHRLFFTFVCLLAALLKKFLTDFDEVFTIARQWYKEQLIKLWGDPAHPSDAVQENVECCICDNTIWEWG